MVLVNVIAFAVLKILHNLCSIQKSLFANNCWSKIRKSAQHDLTFMFIKLSEKLRIFVKIRLVLEIKNVASLIKPRFYLKIGCTEMREHAERFMLIRAAKWRLSFLYQFRRFQKRNLGCNFQTLFARKHVLAHSYILYSILSYFITLSRLKAVDVILKSVSVCIGVFRTQSNICIVNDFWLLTLFS